MKYLEIGVPKAAITGVLLSNILWYSQENTCVGVSFLIKLQTISLLTLLKGDSNTYFLANIRKLTITSILKLSLEILPPVYLHIKQVAHAVIFYFGQVFVFCWSINKNVLEWFLLIISEKYTLTRSTNLLSRNHSTLCFWLCCSLLIPCSLSDWGLICQFAVQSLLIFYYKRWSWKTIIIVYSSFA